MDPKCILFSGPNSGAEKWPISQQPVATCGLSSGKQHGTNKKKLATSSEQPREDSRKRNIHPDGPRYSQTLLDVPRCSQMLADTRRYS